MALIPKEGYVDRLDNLDITFPSEPLHYIEGGCPVDEDWVNNKWGFQQAILKEAGILPLKEEYTV